MSKSNYKVYAYIVKHSYVLGGMLFTICKAQLHVSATNVGHLQVVEWKLIKGVYSVQGGGGVSARSRKWGEVGALVLGWLGTRYRQNYAYYNYV
jgi:hypothetical protein